LVLEKVLKVRPQELTDLGKVVVEDDKALGLKDLLVFGVNLRNQHDGVNVVGVAESSLEELDQEVKGLLKDLTKDLLGFIGLESKELGDELILGGDCINEKFVDGSEDGFEQEFVVVLDCSVGDNIRI